MERWCKIFHLDWWRFVVNLMAEKHGRKRNLEINDLFPFQIHWSDCKATSLGEEFPLKSRRHKGFEFLLLDFVLPHGRNEIPCYVRLEDAMFEVTEERRGAKVVARKPRFDRLRQLVEVIRWGDRQGKKGDQMYPKSVWVMPLACQQWRDVSQILPTHWGWQARTKGCSTQEDWTWGATPCLQLQIISSAFGT